MCSPQNVADFLQTVTSQQFQKDDPAVEKGWARVLYMKRCWSASKRIAEKFRKKSPGMAVTVGVFADPSVPQHTRALWTPVTSLHRQMWPSQADGNKAGEGVLLHLGAGVLRCFGSAL